MLRDYKVVAIVGGIGLVILGAWLASLVFSASFFSLSIYFLIFYVVCLIAFLIGGKEEVGERVEEARIRKEEGKRRRVNEDRRMVEEARRRIKEERRRVK
jgi:hypothetical protein